MSSPEPDLLLTRDVEIPMRDGTVLRGDLYRPAGDDRRPCLLQRTPYIKDFNPGIWVVLDPLKAVAAGFAVLIQDVRGRGRSDGDFTPFTSEADDGADTVVWVAGQSWCDGRVAMYGSSYMAASQWQAATTRPEALRAIAPFQASCDYHEGRSYRGGAFEIGALLGVALNALGGGIAHRMIKEGRLRPEGAREARHAMNDIPALSRTPLDELRAGILGEIAPFFFDWAERSDPSHPYWRRLDLTGRHASVDLPVLHLSSWFDQAHVGTLRNFEAMRAADHPARDDQYLLMGPWTHRVPRGTTIGQLRVGEQYYGTAAMFDLDALQIRWFKGVLDGEAAPWPYRGRVRYFTTGLNRWRDADDWPIPGTEQRSLHVSAQGLGWDAVAASAGEASFTHDPGDPVPTRGGAHMAPEAICPAGPIDQRGVQARDDVLVWTSPTLDGPLEVTGWIDAVLHVSHDADVADFGVVLSDVAPDGTCTNVCDGYLRTAAMAEPAEVTVSLGATSHVFLPGHAIRLHVTGSSTPRHDVVGVPGRPQVQRVHHGGAHPSRVVLPVPPASS